MPRESQRSLTSLPSITTRRLASARTLHAACTASHAHRPTQLSQLQEKTDSKQKFIVCKDFITYKKAYELQVGLAPPATAPTLRPRGTLAAFQSLVNESPIASLPLRLRRAASADAGACSEHAVLACHFQASSSNSPNSLHSLLASAPCPSPRLAPFALSCPAPHLGPGSAAPPRAPGVALP